MEPSIIYLLTLEQLVSMDWVYLLQEVPMNRYRFLDTKEFLETMRGPYPFGLIPPPLTLLYWIGEEMIGEKGGA